MNDPGYRDLADAIILQAVSDYRRAVNRLLSKTYDANREYWFDEDAIGIKLDKSKVPSKETQMILVFLSQF